MTLVEPAVYRELPHPTLLIYPLDPTWKVTAIAETEQAKQAAAEEQAKAEEAWAVSAQAGADVPHGFEDRDSWRARREEW